MMCPTGLIGHGKGTQAPSHGGGIRPFRRHGDGTGQSSSGQARETVLALFGADRGNISRPDGRFGFNGSLGVFSTGSRLSHRKAQFNFPTGKNIFPSWIFIFFQLAVLLMQVNYQHQIFINQYPVCRKTAPSRQDKADTRGNHRKGSPPKKRNTQKKESQKPLPTREKGIMHKKSAFPLHGKIIWRTFALAIGTERHTPSPIHLDGDYSSVG